MSAQAVYLYLSPCRSPERSQAGATGGGAGAGPGPGPAWLGWKLPARLPLPPLYKFSESPLHRK